MEYIRTATVPAASSVRIPLQEGPVLGVYAHGGKVSISWDYNGEIGLLFADVHNWEPTQPFMPGPTSSLVIANAGASDVQIAIRCYHAEMPHI